MIGIGTGIWNAALAAGTSTPQIITATQNPTLTGPVYGGQTPAAAGGSGFDETNYSSTAGTVRAEDVTTGYTVDGVDYVSGTVATGEVLRRFDEVTDDVGTTPVRFYSDPLTVVEFVNIVDSPQNVILTVADTPATMDMSQFVEVQALSAATGYSVTANSNPTDITFDTDTLTFANGPYEDTVTVRVTFELGLPEDIEVSVAVNAAPLSIVGTPEDIVYEDGVAFPEKDYGPNVTGGVPPYTFSLISGFPPGATITGAGVTGGTVNEAVAAPAYSTEWTGGESADPYNRWTATLDAGFSVPSGHTVGVYVDTTSDAPSNTGTAITPGETKTGGFSFDIGTTLYLRMLLIRTSDSAIVDNTLHSFTIAGDPGTDPGPDPDPTPPSIAGIVAIKMYLENLGTTAGRTSTNTLKDPVTDGLPTGWSHSSGVISTTQHSPSPLVDYDLEGYRIDATHNYWIIDQCVGFEEDAVFTPQQYVNIGVSCQYPIIRRCTFKGFDGYGGATKMINMVRSGTGASVSVCQTLLVEDCWFGQSQEDIAKIHGGGLWQRNYFGAPINYPAGTTSWNSGTSYSTGDYVLANGDQMLFKAKSNHSNQQPPATKVDNAYWQSFDPHVDLASIAGMTGKLVMRLCRFVRSTAQAVGMTNGVRMFRNKSTSLSDCLYQQIDIIDCMVDQADTNANPMEVNTGNEGNWEGPINIQRCFLGHKGNGTTYLADLRSDGSENVNWGTNYDVDDDSLIDTPANATEQHVLPGNVSDLPPYWGPLSGNITGSISLNNFVGDVPWMNSNRQIGKGYGEVSRNITAPDNGRIEVRGEDTDGTPGLWQWVGTKEGNGAEAMTVKLPEHTLAMKVRARIQNHASQTSAITAKAISVGPRCLSFDQSNGSRFTALNWSNTTVPQITHPNLIWVTWCEHSDPNDDNRTWHLSIPVNDDTTGYNGGSAQVSATVARIANAVAAQVGGATRVHLDLYFYSGTASRDMLDDSQGDRDFLPPYGDKVGIDQAQLDGGTYDTVGWNWLPPETGNWAKSIGTWFTGISYGIDRSGDPIVANGSGRYTITNDPGFGSRTFDYLLSDYITGLADRTTKLVWTTRADPDQLASLKNIAVDPIFGDLVGVGGPIAGALKAAAGHMDDTKEDGYPYFGEIYVSQQIRAGDITSWTQPIINRWSFGGSYVEMWLEYGGQEIPITTRRNIRGGSSSICYGPFVNGVSTTGTIVSGRIRVAGSYDAGDLIQWNPGGGRNLSQADGPHLDVAGVAGDDIGAGVEFMPLDADLQNDYELAYPGNP